MATNDVLIETGTPQVWADTTDYSAVTSGYARTVQLDLTGVATGKAQQGVKANMGAKRAKTWACLVGLEFATAPAAGTACHVYWSTSFSAAAGTGNDGGASGADDAYQDSSEAEWVKQLTKIGSIILTNDATPAIQRAFVGYLEYIPQYGMPILLNSSGVTLMTDAVEMYIALVPLNDEVA